MKRGSALLVVLGLLSFLVVSAMAFSAYMRSSRLPSSYLLRVSSSRNLVKSALAEAMNEIDFAIGNNPHPGLPEGTVAGRNQWRNRVFLGTNMLVSTDLTVSTLTLEGLAYVPAPLINEVRYYSRRSPAAVWHQLGYDTGRFAFTAVDVSDYFDVNRTMAAPEGGGRTSADNARVSLAYLFENGDHTDWRLKPADWDNFMDAYFDDGTGNKVPLVSVADLNLAIWDKKPNGMISPWCRFIEAGTEFVQDDDAERHTLSNMVFVTDSIYAPPTSQKKTYSLSNSAYQPFTAALKLDDTEGYARCGFLDVLENINTAKIFPDENGAENERSWGDMLAPPEAAQLVDYLDVDNVPCSLALPTVERTPMITGVQLSGDLTTEVAPGEPYTTPDQVAGNETFHYKVSTYTVNVSGDLKANVGAVYPFKHKHDSPGAYKAQAFATVTFVAVANKTVNLRFGSDNWATTPDWSGGSDQQPSAAQAFANADDCPSGFTIRSAPQAVQLKDVTDADSALLEDVPLEFGTITPLAIAKTLPTTANGINGLQADKCTLRVCQKEVMKKINNIETWVPSGEPIVEFGGLPAAADLSGAMPQADVLAAANATYRPIVQVWVRIYDEDSNKAMVDLVPACWKDDRKPADILRDSTSARTRAALRFVPNDPNGTDAGAIKFTGTALEGGARMDDRQPALYLADDPRFNYAPENLVVRPAMSANSIKDIWKSEVFPRAEARDGDIFMSTSDAGYLQSKYELAYLLRISNFNINVDFGCLSGGGYDGKARDDFDKCPANAAVWNTYTPYKTSVRGPDAVFEKTLAVLEGESLGTRVCPYTPDTAVMMGALANTPYDWWAASTCDEGTVKQKMLSDITEAVKYTFSERSDDASTRVKWGDLENLAKDFIDCFRSSRTLNGWESLYDGSASGGLDWDGGLFDGIETGSNVLIDSVDRKYLYGFWRDCFAARQQLFLVFIRAEPMMMGGGAAGQMPPMLGARAVALVWRNPAPTRINAPHPMRVLFYRQFD